MHEVDEGEGDKPDKGHRGEEHDQAIGVAVLAQGDQIGVEGFENLAKQRLAVER